MASKKTEAQGEAAEPASTETTNQPTETAAPASTLATAAKLSTITLAFEEAVYAKIKAWAEHDHRSPAQWLLLHITRSKTPFRLLPAAPPEETDVD